MIPSTIQSTIQSTMQSIPVVIPYIRTDNKWTVFYHCNSDKEIAYVLCCLMDSAKLQSVVRHIIIGSWSAEIKRKPFPDSIKKWCHRYMIEAENRPLPTANERQIDMRTIDIDDDRFRSLLRIIDPTILDSFDDLLNHYKIPLELLNPHILFLNHNNRILINQLAELQIIPAVIIIEDSWVCSILYGSTWQSDIKRGMIQSYIEEYSPNKLCIWESPMTTRWNPADFMEDDTNKLVDSTQIICNMSETEYKDYGIPSGSIWRINNRDTKDISNIFVGYEIPISGEYDQYYIQTNGMTLLRYEGNKWVYRGDITTNLIRLYMTTTKAIINGVELNKNNLISS